MTPKKSVIARDVVIRYGNFTAVDGISFDVYEGEIFGFLGANGAGKTTAIRALCGLITPDSGFIETAGMPSSGNPDMIKKNIGYMSQKFTLYPDLSVGENMVFAAALRKMPDERLKNRKRELFDFIGFSVPEDTMVKNLPGGIKQQIALAAAMLHDPKIVFLDEPTAGVSPSARLRFWNLIKKTAASGKTVFVTTHYMDEAEYCDRVALMQSGKIAALDSPAALKKRFFPEPLYLAQGNDVPAFADEIRKCGCAEISFYGKRLHAAIKNTALWTQLLAGFEGRVSVREIQPSLEDVFIKVIGAGNERI